MEITGKKYRIIYNLDSLVIVGEYNFQYNANSTTSFNASIYGYFQSDDFAEIEQYITEKELIQIDENETYQHEQE